MNETITCIFCTKESQATDEHVVPEFAGGSLIIRDVCKTCNDKMGSDFEGPLSHSIIFRLQRYHYEIQGKSKSPINPFPNTGTTGSGQKIKMNPEHKFYSVTQVEDKPLETGGVEVKLAVDASEKEKIPEIIESKIRRIAKNEWIDMSPSEVDDLVAKSLGSLPTEFKIQSTNPMIHYNESIDLNQLNLLMMKIAYEIAFHHHGSKVSSDCYYQQLREAIHTRNVNSRIAGRLLPQPDQFLFIPAPENSHCILLCRNICYIRLFKFSAIIQVIEENSPHSLSQENWVIYWFNFVKKSCKKHNFLEYASGAIQ